MSDTYIYIAILITAVATYLPRFLGVFSSDFVNEDGKLFKFVSENGNKIRKDLVPVIRMA